MSKPPSISHSFMVLSFVTAALLIGVQWQEDAPPSQRSVAPSSLSFPPASQTLGFLPSAPSGHRPEPTFGDTPLEALPATAPTRLVVQLSNRRLFLYKAGLLHASYEIAVGREGWETPSGEFQVIHMETDPIWKHPFTGEIVPPGRDNPLGSRWIGFWGKGEQQFGFHGTHEEELIGQAVSHGCIRLREADVQVLYEQVAIGTPVLIRP